MVYHFPDLSLPGANNKVEYDLGRRWSVRSIDPACVAEGACVWLGFDPAADRYYVLPNDPPGAPPGG